MVLDVPSLPTIQANQMSSFLPRHLRCYSVGIYPVQGTTINIAWIVGGRPCTIQGAYAQELPP